MERKKRKTTRKKSTKNSIFIKICLLILVLFVLSATIFKITELIFTNKKEVAFPKLEISLKDVPIEEIDTNSKDIKYLNNTAVLTINDEPTEYNDVEIKGRGNTTWTQIKKPYQIKLASKESLFNLGESKKWILLANYFDPSSLRNDTAFYLEKMFNTKYRPNGNFVELYIDDVYRGLYYLTEKIEIDKSRINLSSSSDLLFEIDNLHEEAGRCYHDKYLNCFVLKESTNADEEDINATNFINNIITLESAIKRKDYEKIKMIIDVDSFAKYYLLNEFIVNPDGYSTSFFIYTKDEKIYAGPNWDFDLALGNKSWTTDGLDQDLFLSPFETMALKSYKSNADEAPFVKSVTTFLFDLMEIPEFENRVKEIYQETLSGKGEELLDYIKSQAEYIRPAALRDQNRWKLKTNFDEEVDYLIDWVAKRYNHFEQTYGPDSPPIN